MEENGACHHSKNRVCRAIVNNANTDVDSLAKSKPPYLSMCAIVKSHLLFWECLLNCSKTTNVFVLVAPRPLNHLRCSYVVTGPRLARF